jgi:hypothetical protein
MECLSQWSRPLIAPRVRPLVETALTICPYPGLHQHRAIAPNVLVGYLGEPPQVVGSQVPGTATRTACQTPILTQQIKNYAYNLFQIRTF